jgi:hypothetical protein
VIFPPSTDITPGREEGNQKLQRLHKVKRDAKQRLPLAQIHSYEPQVEHLEISQSTVNDNGFQQKPAVADS